MRKHIRPLLIRVLAPWLVGQLLTICNSELQVPQSLHAALPSLAELLEWAAILGIASILAAELMKDFAHDLMEDVRSGVLPQISDVIRTGMLVVANVVAKGIAEKEFFPSEWLRAREPPQPILSAADPKLAEAKRLYEDGQPDAAIAILSPLASTDDKYGAELLKILVHSPNEQHWRLATPMLQRFGRFEHYILLAYKYWTIRKLSNAIALADDALKVASDVGDALSIARAKNNVAYYVADAEVVEREAEARRYCDEALTSVREMQKLKTVGVNQTVEAKLLATCGYVHVTFAKSEEDLRRGLKECEEAQERGADLELFMRHMDRARARLVSLREATTNR